MRGARWVVKAGTFYLGARVTSEGVCLLMVDQRKAIKFASRKNACVSASAWEKTRVVRLVPMKATKVEMAFKEYCALLKRWRSKPVLTGRETLQLDNARVKLERAVLKEKS